MGLGGGAVKNSERHKELGRQTSRRSSPAEQTPPAPSGTKEEMMKNISEWPLASQGQDLKINRSSTLKGRLPSGRRLECYTRAAVPRRRASTRT